MSKLVPSGIGIDPMLHAMLEEVRRRHWLIFCFGCDLTRLSVVAGVYKWDAGYTDVVLLRDADDAVSYRVRTETTRDIFAPAAVTWYYVGEAAWAVRAVLDLDPPGRFVTAEHAAPFVGVPLDQRRPVTIRPA
jgi:hypothetical protein